MATYATYATSDMCKHTYAHGKWHFATACWIHLRDNFNDSPILPVVACDAKRKVCGEKFITASKLLLKFNMQRMRWPYDYIATGHFGEVGENSRENQIKFVEN